MRRRENVRGGGHRTSEGHVSFDLVLVPSQFVCSHRGLGSISAFVLWFVCTVDTAEVDGETSGNHTFRGSNGTEEGEGEDP